jgi:hypothetical protein
MLDFSNYKTDKLYHRIFDEVKVLADMDESGNRRERFYYTVQFLAETIDLEHRGPTAEAGCWRGMSSRIMLEYMSCRYGSQCVLPHHIFDSFEGLSEPQPEDLIGTPYTREDMVGRFSSRIETTKNTLGPFEMVHYHKGWIPDVFSQPGFFPEKYSFVHVDVELYEPTYACLVYFWPKIQKGGFLVCDDCAYKNFPGSGKAMQRFCQENKLSSFDLPTGNGVIYKGE